MKEKNKKLLIVVGVLLLVIGISFAYFVSSVIFGGEGAKIKASTASINGANIEVNGTLSFNDTDIYPGHITISGIELIATGDGEFVPYNLVWKGTNSLNTPLNFRVYKSDNKIETNVTCNKTTKIENGAQILAEECTITNNELLGSQIYSGTINKDSEKVVLSDAEFITASTPGNKVYYYVILEYPNLNEEQNNDIGGSFNGNVTVEENNSSADITIASIYKKEKNKDYQEINNIPTGDYILNLEKSTCTNNAKPTWNEETNSLQVKSLTISGTECNLYFDEKPTSEDTVNKLGITGVVDQTSSVPTFGTTATKAENADTNNGIFRTDDGMYGGKSVYWRGAATTNHVIFANKCWRIVRINGDGTIRLIYNGTPSGTAPNQTCPGNGSNSGSVAVASQTYNSSYVRSEYVGYTYTQGSQRPDNNTSGTASNLKEKTDTWFNTNITGDNLEKIADGKFCNDRNVEGGTWVSISGSTFSYAAVGRLETNKTPTLNCSAEDIYILKAGAITADEISFAGGVFNTVNQSYYLYNGSYYWTMTPSHWDYYSSSSSIARIFIICNYGQLDKFHASGNYGIRPVINLKATTNFTGEGTTSKPYVVVD